MLGYLLVLKGLYLNNKVDFFCHCSLSFSCDWSDEKGIFFPIVRLARYFVEKTNEKKFIASSKYSLFDAATAFDSNNGAHRRIRLAFLDFAIRLFRQPLLFGMYHLEALKKRDFRNTDKLIFSKAI